MDPEHCRGQFPFFRFLSGVKGTGQLERMKNLIKINEKSSASWGGGGGALNIVKLKTPVFKGTVT
jgi:hypothetical protein